MRRYRKGFTGKKGSPKESNEVPVQAPLEIKCENRAYVSLPSDAGTHEADFAEHIYQFLGETVTVFVKGGGASGMSFTGALANVCHAYIQLIARIGPLPSCGLSNACKYTAYRNNAWNLLPCSRSGNIRTGVVNIPGSVINIPLDKIVSFVHNLI